MDKWVTLLTFKHPTQAHMIKTKLESEGIRVFLKNEYTAQLIPQATEPASPIKLRIHEEDLDAAVKLLKENGYIGEEKEKLSRSALINFLDLLTSKIPGVRTMPLQLRLVIATAAVLVVATVIVALLTLPSGT